jgi:hypothetical protein
MQLTETLALADLTAVISVGIAAIVAYTGYQNTRHSSRQTFDNFTLRFIETENADPHLYAARRWLDAAAAAPSPPTICGWKTTSKRAAATTQAMHRH